VTANKKLKQNLSFQLSASSSPKTMISQHKSLTQFILRTGYSLRYNIKRERTETKICIFRENGVSTAKKNKRIRLLHAESPSFISNIMEACFA
jgi:hypothetical protein